MQSTALPKAASPPSPTVTSSAPPCCTYSFIAPNCAAGGAGHRSARTRGQPAAKSAGHPAPRAHLCAREHFSRARDDPDLRLHQSIEGDRVLVAARRVAGRVKVHARGWGPGWAAGAAGTGGGCNPQAGGLRSDFVGGLQPSPQSFEAGGRREDLTLTAVEADRLPRRLSGGGILHGREPSAVGARLPARGGKRADCWRWGTQHSIPNLS